MSYPHLDLADVLSHLILHDGDGVHHVSGVDPFVKLNTDYDKMINSLLVSGHQPIPEADQTGHPLNGFCKNEKIVTDKLKKRLVNYLKNNNNMAPTKRSDLILYTTLMRVRRERELIKILTNPDSV